MGCVVSITLHSKHSHWLPTSSFHHANKHLSAECGKAAASALVHCDSQLRHTMSAAAPHLKTAFIIKRLETIQCFLTNVGHGGHGNHGTHKHEYLSLCREVPVRGCHSCWVAAQLCDTMLASSMQSHHDSSCPLPCSQVTSTIVQQEHSTANEPWHTCHATGSGSGHQQSSTHRESSPAGVDFRPALMKASIPEDTAMLYATIRNERNPQCSQYRHH